MAYSKHHEARETGTYLEDFLERLQPLPNDVQRSFHLMRELDKDAADLQPRLADLERRFLAQARQRVEALPPTATVEEKVQAVGEDKELGEEIKKLRGLLMTKQREKLDVAGQVAEGLESHLKMLQADMDDFQTELRETGEYDFLGARKGDAVAFKQNVYETHYVLGQVVSYRSETGTYEVVDVDEDSRVYALPETQVILLPPPSEAQKLKFQRGDEVFAVYPETTSFYLATIAQPPRRGSASPHEPPRLAVQFQDDADEQGITPIRFVNVEYVFKAS